MTATSTSSASTVDAATADSESASEAATDPGQKLPAEENWFRALARVKCWRYGGTS